MKSNEIRETFLKFFENYHHQRVKSSSLIPAEDPTLLFTNAGMNQFKDCFLGLHDPGYRRATTSQKCVRAGGKHNDLENVGFTARHHTFFEMLGNFSFGDYFKKDAIAFAWELLTRHYHLPKEKLRVTVFEKDDEAFDLWKAQGINPAWIGRLGEKDNFWAMGDTGPCGPCTEIYYDWGEAYGCKKPNCAPGCDCPRFLEIWNLVFMQFNRDTSGKLTPLPKPSVDTGSGLERVAAVLQGKFSNYDTDVFAGILAGIEKVTGKKYGVNEETSVSMRVIADHIRACTFLLADGVTPSNEGRGYVLRRILRRAIRHGKKLGCEKPFMFELVKSVVDSFGTVYPELGQNKKAVEVVMKEEEERFYETLSRGMGLLDETMKALIAKKGKVLPGDVAFKLYDTFGFPFDLIQVIVAEHGLTVDDKAFEASMEKQRSQSSWKGEGNANLTENINKAIQGKKLDTTFKGYEGTKATGTAQLLLNKEGNAVNTLAEKDEGLAIFDQTPFYAEGGGQVGDKGRFTSKEATGAILNTTKIGKIFLHWVKVEKGSLLPGKPVELQVDVPARKLTARNHTATHMLHAALRSTLGDRVKQAGSLVDAEHLRFDFTFPKGLSQDEIQKIEKIVNDEIERGADVEKQEMDYESAIKKGALAFFDEKYGDKVRVISVGGADKPFSVELCGGTHLDSTGEIGLFKIVSESSVASGVRRIEAITSVTARKYLEEQASQLRQKLDQMQTQIKSLQKENEDLKFKVVQSGAGQGGGGGALHDKAKDIKAKNLKLVAERVAGANAKMLRTLVDQVRDKLKERTVVVLATESDGKAALCVGLTKDLVGQYDAGKLIQPLAVSLGGTGGGRADFAQAGGTKVEEISNALQQVEALL